MNLAVVAGIALSHQRWDSTNLIDPNSPQILTAIAVKVKEPLSKRGWKLRKSVSKNWLSFEKGDLAFSIGFQLRHPTIRNSAHMMSSNSSVMPIKRLSAKELPSWSVESGELGEYCQYFASSKTHDATVVTWARRRYRSRDSKVPEEDRTLARKVITLTCRAIEQSTERAK